MELSVPHRPTSALVFDSPSRRRHHHHRRGHNYHYYGSDSDTDDSTLSPSSYDSSDSDDSTYYRYHVPLPRRARTSRRWRWPRGGVLAYPGCAPWVPRITGGGAVVGGLVQGPAQLVSAAAASQAQMLQLQAQALQAQAQVQAQAQQQQQQQQPRRYGYRRFHYQGGERVQSGSGHGHHHHHHHHHRRAASPRRCILPRFGRWLIGDPPERGRRSRGCCDDGSECCGDGCGAGTATTTVTPTVHHEDEYWGPGVRRDRPLLYPL